MIRLCCIHNMYIRLEIMMWDTQCNNLVTAEIKGCCGLPIFSCSWKHNSAKHKETCVQSGNTWTVVIYVNSGWTTKQWQYVNSGWTTKQCYTWTVDKQQNNGNMWTVDEQQNNCCTWTVDKQQNNSNMWTVDEQENNGNYMNSAWTTKQW